MAYPRETWRSPETTSGRVVKNVAEAMFARGMLGNKSEFSTPSAPCKPVYYADFDNSANAVNAMIGGGAKAVISSPKKVEQGVPNVVGLGMRDAIKLLEDAGYNVTISGSGYVISQSPGAGANVPLGTKVKLQLKE